MISGSFARTTRFGRMPGYRAFMTIIAERLRHRAFEALVLGFAAVSVVEALVANGVHPRLLVAALALGWSLPFLALARYPFGAPFVSCAAIALLAFAAGQSIDHMSTPYLAAVGAAASFGLIEELRIAVAGLLALAGLAALVAFETRDSVDLVWIAIFFLLAWFFGLALGTRTRQARALRARAEAAELAHRQAVLHERTRIAGELHDVVAHSLSVMVVTASGVRRLLDSDQEREREALRSVEITGRQALAEMRRMLGVMPSEELIELARAPQPGLANLDSLIAQIVEAGLPATLRIEGTRPQLSAGVDLSAYRIVQEGLSNALADPGCGRADVVVRYVDSEVQIEITDDGPGLANFDQNGESLIGMRERIALYGGTLHVDPRQDGGFVLHAQLPVEAAL
jgi:signal transduction histidine kinase